MPFTFSTSEFTRPLADFGNDAAQMILQTGATIQQGLQSMMTNRQVQALGAELGTLNPESPEWAQQAVKLGSRYPLAMKSPAGQFMLGTQAKANADWRRMQQATQQSNLTYQRQLGMENLRTQNDIKLEGIRHQNRMALGGGRGVDLRGMNFDEEQPGAPMGIPAMGAGMPGLAAAANAASPQAEQVPLFGMRGGLGDIARGAFRDIQEEQDATGMIHTPAQVNMRILDAKRAARAEEKAAKKAEEDVLAATKKEEAAEKKNIASEERMFRGMNATTLRQERTNINSRINSIKRELDSDFDKELETIDTDDAGKPKGLSKEQTTYFRRRRALADELAALTADYENATKELEALGGGSPKKELRFDPATGKLVPR